jgi:hypothetical protein
MENDKATSIAAEPSMLYHLAYITTHIDIIDVQMFTGTKRLLGRKVSTKDHETAARRMRAWSETSSAKIAVLHAFKVLQETLVQNEWRSTGAGALSAPGLKYACRADVLIYRPWVLFLAALTIWSYQYATTMRRHVASLRQAHHNMESVQQIACQYIMNCASTDSPDRLVLLMSTQGCVALLRFLSDDFDTAEFELLQEASLRLRRCAEMLELSNRQ